MAHDVEILRATLVQIEEMMAEAERTGASFPQWMVQLSHELRATLERNVAMRGETADLMRADPKATLGAQAHLDPAALRVLKG